MQDKQGKLAKSDPIEAIGSLQKRKQFVVEAFGGAMTLGYKVQEFENGRQHDGALNIGGQAGVTFRFETWESDQ